MASTSLAVLPNGLLASSSSHRFLRLPHPRTGLPSLYLPVLIPGAPLQILEIQTIRPDEERSWFLGDSVVQDGKILLFTPIDPVFLLLPVVEATTGNPSRFLLLDHIFSTAQSHASYKLPRAFPAPDVKGKKREVEEVEEVGLETDDVLRLGELEGVERALRRVCDVKEIAEGMTAYRLSLPKTLAYLRKKAARLAQPGTFARFPSLARGLAKDGLVELGEPSPALDAVKNEARLAQALLLLQPYLSTTIYEKISKSLGPFPLLSAHQASLFAQLAPLPEIKPAKTKEDPKKRKTASSQGVAKLAKVDTKGMAKLDGFFKKKPKIDESAAGKAKA